MILSKQKNLHLFSSQYICVFLLDDRLALITNHSTAHNISQIMFIFGSAIYLSMSMNPIDYGVSMFIF